MDQQDILSDLPRDMVAIIGTLSSRISSRDTTGTRTTTILITTITTTGAGDDELSLHTCIMVVMPF